MARAAVFAVPCLLLDPLAARAQPSALETSVKSTFLYKFGPFVDWPAASFETPISPFVLCIVGDDPFGPMLDQAVAGQHVGQHPVAVRRMARIERGAGGCHVLYAGGSKAQPTAQALAAVQGAPVLTVTDDARDGAARGIIHFVLQNSRVRFHVDTAAAAQNGLTISSKLLSLALSVRSLREAAP